jgi:hypothetical protein
LGYYHAKLDFENAKSNLTNVKNRFGIWWWKIFIRFPELIVKQEDSGLISSIQTRPR